MFSKTKKFILISSVIISAGLLFVISASSAWAGECEKNQEKFSLSAFLNPMASLAEKVVRDFGYEVALAAAPDPDLCGTCLSSDSVGCSGPTPTATVNWAQIPLAGYLYYHAVVYTGGWTFCSNGGGSNCLFSGTKVVRYGADSCGYVYGNFTDSVSCDGRWGFPGPFGASDPCPNIGKHCDYASGVDFKSANISTVSYTFSSGLINNTLYSWLVEAYYNGPYGHYPSKLLGVPNQPCGSFTTLNCAPPPSPTADIKANGSDGPISIAYNTAVNLTWTSTNATACTASGGWSGAKATSDSQSTGNLTGSATFTLTCTGPGGSSSDSVTVNVGAAPPADFTISSVSSATCGQLVVNWNDTTGETNYEVQRGTDNVTFATIVATGLPVNTVTYPDTTVTPGIRYYYRIRAYNAGGSTYSTGAGNNNIATACVVNQAPIADARISLGTCATRTDSVTVTQGVAVNVWLCADDSTDPNGWTDATNGVQPAPGKCDWNSDLNQGAPTYETTINTPASAAACNINLGSKTFNDAPGTYTYSVLRITDKPGLQSNIDTVQVTVQAGPDLITSNLGYIGTLTTGSAINFFGHVRNIGGSQAAASSARFCIDNASCLTSTTGRVGTDRPVAVLAAGAISAPISPSTTWTATAGNHIVYFCADVGNAVPESNETNNCTSLAFTINNPITLTVVINPSSINVGGTTNAKAYYDDGSGPIDVTALSNWSSDNPSKATVNNGAQKGLVTGIAPGSASITATYNAIPANATVTVTFAPFWKEIIPW